MDVRDKVHLFTGNRSDTATLTGGGWEPAMPLSRMQTQDLSDIARSVDLDPANTQFNVALDGVHAIRGIMFQSNMSSRGKFRVTSTDATFETDVYPWDWQRIGIRVPFGSLPWGAPGLYDGFVDWPNPDRKPWAIAVFDRQIGSTNWRIEIDDQGNSAGRLDVSRLYMWDAFVPTINYPYGNNGLSLIDNSISSKTLGGAKHIWRLPNKRRWQCQLELMPEEEAYGRFWTAIDTAGFDQECFVVPRANDVTSLQARSFAGRLVQPDPIAQAYFQRASAGFGIEEL